jgi:hypothetical protein
MCEWAMLISLKHYQGCSQGSVLPPLLETGSRLCPGDFLVISYVLWCWTGRNSMLFAYVTYVFHIPMSHMLFTYVTCYSHMSHLLFTYVTHVIHICHTCYSHMSHMLFTYVTYVIHICYSHMLFTYVIHICYSHMLFTYVTYVIHLCHICYSLMSHMLFTYVTYVIHICHMLFKHVVNSLGQRNRDEQINENQKIRVRAPARAT